MRSSPRGDWSERSRELSTLLSRVKLGDREAFATLYRHTSPHLLGVVLRINRDRAQAEDVLQEVYVNIWRSAQGFDTALGQPLTWLTSIARNKAIDSLRRRQTEPRTVSAQVDDADDENGHDMLNSLASDEAGPLESLQQASEARQLTACMEGLSREQQQCLALAFYQGLSHAELAAHLVQPLGTVKSWVRRALGSLKSCLTKAITREAAEGS